MPDIVTMFFTPSSPASPMVRRKSSACFGPTPGSGLSGLPLQFSAGQLHAPGGELTEVVRAGLLGGQQQVDDGSAETG